MTQAALARAGRITQAMRAAARAEHCEPEQVRHELANGRAVLPANPAHKGLAPIVAGRFFTTKVNANLGRSTEHSTNTREIAKLKAALAAGADFIMDLSVGPGLGLLRRRMLAACPAPFGTVPIYEALSRCGNEPMQLSSDLLLQVIREQAEQGVDFMTLHAGLLRRHLPYAVKRRAGIVSRGGAILAAWMAEKQMENPLYTVWDEILNLARRHDVTISLGDGLRPGCLADAGDRAQYAELDTLGELTQRCRKADVQVMVEGPGHVPFNRIAGQMKREHRVCNGAPFYVLGPIVTDVAPGYDHITAAIGATAAAFHGAALLCYVTPAEHLSLPEPQDVIDGIMAFRIAAHAADVARGLPGARDWDDAMTRARVALDWPEQFRLAINPKVARERFAKKCPAGRRSPDFCTMCGPAFCAMRTSRKLGNTLKRNVPKRKRD